MAQQKKRTTKQSDAQKERIKAETAKKSAELARKKEIKDEIISVLIIALGVFLAVSLHTNTTGPVGEVIQDVLFGLFGKVAYAFPYYLIVYGILNFAQKTSYITWRSILSLIVLFFLVATINASFSAALPKISWKLLLSIYNLGKSSSGLIGTLIYSLLFTAIGKTGVYIVCAVGIIITLLFIINSPLSALFDKLKIKAQAKREAVALAMEEAEHEEKQIKIDDIKKEIEHKTRIDEVHSIENPKIDNTHFEDEIEEQLTIPASDQTMKLPKFKLFGKKEAEPAAIQEEAPETSEEFDPNYRNLGNKERIISFVNDDNLFGSGQTKSSEGFGLEGKTTVSDGKGLDGEVNLSPMAPAGANATSAKLFPDENYAAKPIKYKFPPISLLNKSKAGSKSSGGDLAEQSRMLEDALASFGVRASVVDVTQGPSVTRFEVQPAPGVKVSSISKLHDDIMLHLKAKSLRIEAPIPGKAAVGIEVSNNAVSMVSLREILDSKEFTNAKSKISMGLGKNIAGQAVVSDLKEMPHLLIAGSTGSGKSVCINSIIMSFIYKATPEEVKLILIDPKVVELSVYNGIPHLLIPVVTEPSKAAAALGWAVTEMDERYKKFETESVRDLTSYNETCIANDEKEKVLPQIVIIIDEMADLMAVAQNQIETYINRLAAKARAAGIHLIFATQHPSVNVISGTIKSNFPSRIALAVSSMMDSRVILDEGGAETLIGKGDMLYSPQSLPKPMRVQGCFVSDEEIEKVIDYIKKNSGVAVYSEKVNEALSKTPGKSDSSNDDEDEFYKEAVEFAAGSDTVSVSAIQRRFRIGYNRAARLIDEMEARGVVGPQDGSHPRKVLITAADVQNAVETKAAIDEEEVDF